MLKCQVTGLNFFRGDDGPRPFTTLALAEVEFPELKMSLKDVRLTHSDKGWRALPSIAQRQGNRAINWSSLSPLGAAACEAMVAMYEKMGGQKPEKAATNAAAKRRIAERKAKEAPKPEPASNMPVAEMGLSIDAGLARTLGVAQ